MKWKTIGSLGAGVAIGLALGLGIQAPPQPNARPTAHPLEEQTWTCSMHPQIRQPKPGLCPICAMELIPVATDSASVADDARTLTLSENAQALAEVETAPVERRWVDVEIRLPGKVRFDESRLAYITARVPGRIDRLFAGITGVPVRKGEILAEIYSPDLLSAQQELLQLREGLKDNRHQGARLESTREKLRLWGMTDAQIADIERSGQVRERLAFHAPLGGVILEKEAVEGMYVEPGTRLFTVADLSSVWVQLEAYERDLAWIRYGQKVEFQVEAYPGETFEGRVFFIAPSLDPATRTVAMRVVADNTDGKLKLDMLVRAMVKARVMGDPAAEAEPPLVIPATAPLITGTRAVVYVALPEGNGKFEGREIVLGPRAGGYYVVKSGLAESERVVTRGNFKIDSSLQIQGRPSMMQPGAEPSPPPATGGKAQTHCPVMGGAINREVFLDYQGLRIYFCCPGCEETFLQEPEAYLEKMRAAGVEPEVVK